MNFKFFLGFIPLYILLGIYFYLTHKEDEKKIKFSGQTSLEFYRQIRRLEFDGHTYIFFSREGSSWADNYLHDPDCKCKKGT